MRRIPWLLVLVASALTIISGPAFAAAGRAAASPPANSSLPTIGGTASEGQTLTASSGAWTGTTPIGYAYQWQRCNSSGAGCGSIGKATSQNYVVSKADVAKTIRVEVTATNVDGKNQALSAATGAIAERGSAPVNTKQPNPSGTATAGQTIKVDDGSWSGSKPITFSYQWQSCTAGSKACTDIAGRTDSSLVIGTSQIGSMLRATVTATNSTGRNSAFSNLTSAVLAQASAPVNTSLPAIAGPRFLGQTLHASTGVWTGVATNGFSYQWSRCNSNGNSCASISGATGQSYGIGEADLRMALRVNVTAKNATGSTMATSAASVIAARAALTARFDAVLRGGQEVSRPVGMRTGAAGHFTARVTGKTLRWTLSYSHLTGRATVGHLNKGVRGLNGVTFKTLCRPCSSPTHGTLTLTASQLDALLRGRAYVNVHTTRNTQGEIRGQIHRMS
jgi:CHRD domain-containing protein